MLRLEEVKKSYRHDRGLTQVSLTIEPNNLYLFVGENGSGKSTTIKLISNVIFHSKNEGKIINGFQRMIYLPDKRSYPKLLTVETYLKYYLPSIEKKEGIKNWMERYHLPNKRIGSLSKGMLQKLGILQTLLNSGDLYLLDEPTDGLDTESIQIFKEDVLQLLNNKKTIIISTHNKSLYKDLKPIIYYFKEGICNGKK
ncbi:MAG: ABC transporter ATP-binding protein [Anaeroplasma bactoclasticum]|nr:ABC transporter ATP-binding protein [Anaeroplasma bactoclasticum]MCM1557364.1 ABC transporter ATP-binding protein [Anaeroplasma bactoclasticum]